jgi:mRNA-degrading endonuclease YafQ of YafQ-DinJ toxin-antitoxin module
MKPNIYIQQSAAFAKLYHRLPKHMQQRVARTIHKLTISPTPPGLRVEPLKLSGRNVRSCRVDEGNRLIFEITEHRTLNLLYIGGHDVAYRFAESLRALALGADITEADIVGGFSMFPDQYYDVSEVVEVVEQYVDQDLGDMLQPLAEVVSRTLNQWMTSGIPPVVVSLPANATNINVIPADGRPAECKDILLVFCLGDDDFNERLQQTVYHGCFYCPSTRMAIMITSKWDEAVWRKHSSAMDFAVTKFLAFLTAQDTITPLGTTT